MSRLWQPVGLFCALVPTGVLNHHKIAMIFEYGYYENLHSEYGYETNDAGEITGLRRRPFTTDGTLRKLSHFTELQRFRLDGPGIMDSGLVSLKGLTNLQELVLWAISFTAAGVVELQKALPTCRIYH